MSRKAFIYFALLLCGMSGVLTACNDDLDDLSQDGFPKGEAVITIEANLSPLSSNTTQTRATATVAPPGKGWDIFNDMYLLAYDKNGRLMEGFPKEVVPYNGAEYDAEGTYGENADRDNADASNGKTAESTTKCLKKNVVLPYGEYYLIAVSNLTYPDASGNPLTDTKTALERRKGEYETLDDLRKMKMKWHVNNYRHNREMLGFFTNNGDVPNSNSEFKTVKIDKPNMTLHTWMRRCASKITIDFDGSELRENVYVYIEKAEIFDIASECTLGFGKENTIDDQAEVYNNTITDEAKLANTTSSIHHITYGVGNNFANWPCISKGSPRIMNGKDTVNFHAEDQKALFFYENMHGEAAVNGKTPVPDLVNGGVANSDLKKDGVPCGTYVEVTAHYHSDAPGNITDGTIKYRFLIGKDAKKNCDAERNYHYKLTLKLRGNANDYDWHIDYKDEPGFDVPNPWYVSYLYNQRATLPFKYTPEPGWKVVKMEAEIIKNPWFPSDVTEEELTNPNIPIIPTTPAGDLDVTYNEEKNKHDGNGFLSLREDTRTVVTDADAAKTSNGTWPGYNDNSSNYNEAYYKGEAYGNKTDMSKRVYYFDDDADKDATNTGNEAYSYSKDGDKYIFNIPLFTRPKVLVKQTGYSGNNPFVGYQRVARVKLTATLQKIGGQETKTVSENVNVVQVRRVVNPKGVYRSADNYDPFRVKLMWLGGDDDTEFEPSISRGPWMAEILGDANFITLDGKQTVSGSTNTEIDFTIRFNRIKTGGNKNAVVRVWYHNYTCSHLIFVRQGYEPQALCDKATQYNENSANPETATAVKWQTCNMIARNVQATDPRDEGSLFKFGTSGYAIDAINNIYKDAAGNNLYGNLKAEQFNNNTGPFRIANVDNGNLNSGTTAWGSISTDLANGFSSGKMAKAATGRHFEQLYLTTNIEFGYGVLYADGATETQTSVSDAYGYYRRDTDTGKKGMRGMFAYYLDANDNNNKFNGRSVFFPIGRSGYGHRKAERKYNDPNDSRNDPAGILRYSCNRGSSYPTFSASAPLFVSLYRRPGAIYWARKRLGNNYLEWNGTKPGSDYDGYGMDINYFTYDVNIITGSNVSNGADACFVRCVDE